MNKDNVLKTALTLLNDYKNLNNHEFNVMIEKVLNGMDEVSQNDKENILNTISLQKLEITNNIEYQEYYEMAHRNFKRVIVEFYCDVNLNDDELKESLSNTIEESFEIPWYEKDETVNLMYDQIRSNRNNNSN